MLHRPLSIIALALVTACGPGVDSDGTRDAGRADGADPVTDGGEPSQDGGGEDGGAGTCVPGARRCADPALSQFCDESGVWEDAPCASSAACQDGLCLQRICSPGEWRCLEGDRVLETCNASGTGYAAETCPEPGACKGGVCEHWVCHPDDSRCVSTAIEEICAPDGSGWTAVTCTAGQQCLAGACVVPVCTPASTRCLDPATMEVCRADGSGWETQPCPEPGACTGGACAAWVCTPAEKRCAGATAVDTCEADGSGWTASPCSGSDVCLAGACTAPVCVAGDTRCVDASTLETCRADRTGWGSAPCGTNQVCTGGACLAAVCTPYDRRCANDTTAEVCSADGTGWSASPCNAGSVCVGTGTCAAQICTPGAAGCFDETTRGTCNTTGTGYNAGAVCTVGQVCAAGACISDPCAAAAAEGSPAGCSFSTTSTVGSAIGAGQLLFGVVNPGTSSATVTVLSPSSAISNFVVPGRSSLAASAPNEPGAAGTGRANTVWKLTSDKPVVLYQGTPRTTNWPMACGWGLSCLLAGSSCDATNTYCEGITEVAQHAAWSRVLPGHALGSTYVVPAMPHFELQTTATSGQVTTTSYDWALTLVSASSASTNVTLRLKGATAAGGGIAAGSRSGTLNLVLAAGERIRLVSAPAGVPSCESITDTTRVCTYPSDLSGTLVTANLPVGLISGSSCYRVPAAVGFCDHLEEWVPPYAALSTVHVGGSEPTLDAPMLYKVIATKDATVLSWSPSTLSGGATLNAGEFRTVMTSEPLVVSATKPVLVMRMMTGRDYGTNVSADPSLELLAPVAQGRTQGVTTVPAGFDASAAHVYGPSGSTVHVDGVATPLTDIGGSGYGFARVVLGPGFHAFTGGAALGVSLSHWRHGMQATDVTFPVAASYGVSTLAVSGTRRLNTDAPDLP